MQRCIDLAKNGLGTTYPNPLVGSVVVFEDRIIGEGWHQKAGKPHAEVNAICSVKDKKKLKEATIYVNLEPCNHFGKTPPCVDFIIQNNIQNVVIGTTDPNIKVSGSGVKKLEKAGVRVTLGVLENKCKKLNRRFFTFHEKKRPYIILKWAQTQDGFIAPSEDYRINKNLTERKPVWITNSLSRQLIHKWRSEEASILIGTQTAIDDNPRLNARDWAGNNPIRLVLDSKDRIPKKSNIFDNSSKTIVFTKDLMNFEGNIAQQISEILFLKEIQTLIVEGGQQTIQTFIDENIWDEARVFIGKSFFEKGTKAPEIKATYSEKYFLENDELLIFKNND